MAVYWHPFLTQFLRQDYSNLLDIEEERAVKELAQMVGEERLRQIVERLFTRKSDDNDN
ncbi:MAG: hypothetical protein ACE5PV_11495 [Candidatus Poribacteria bacterium]